MLRFNPMLASPEFLLELSDGLWGGSQDEIKSEVHAHSGDYAIEGYNAFALPGNWDLYLISAVEGHA